MTPEFNTADPATWPEVLTLSQIAELWKRTPKGLTQALSRGSFRPAPMDGKPRRWRKSDVMRHLGRSR
jgi:hypothetical protein